MPYETISSPPTNSQPSACRSNPLSQSAPPYADGSIASNEQECLPAPNKVKIAMINSHKIEFERKILRWNSYLDVLLVFAGLFCAIITAFVIQSSQDLREDFEKTSADLLRMIVNNSTLNVAQKPFHVPATAIWVSGLWFSSLSLSLLTALGAMWGKLWAQERAIRANKFFAPLDNIDVTSSEAGETLSQMLDVRSWLISGIHESTMTGESMTAVLPALMHVAILLFMIGLIVFVWVDAFALSCLLLAFVAIGVVAYFVSARARATAWYQFLIQ